MRAMTRRLDGNYRKFMTLIDKRIARKSTTRYIEAKQTARLLQQYRHFQEVVKPQISNTIK